MSRCFRDLQRLQLIRITPLDRSARAKPWEIGVMKRSNLGYTLVNWTRVVIAITVSDVHPEFVRLGFGNVRGRQ